eukprot:11411896-Karenia_brevis.AAC.1
MLTNSGAIVLNDSLAALIVFQHLHVKCARKCFLRKSIVIHSGNINCNETLAAKIVFTQDAPTQTVRRVLAATT